MLNICDGVSSIKPKSDHDELKYINLEWDPERFKTGLDAIQ